MDGDYTLVGLMCLLKKTNVALSSVTEDLKKWYFLSTCFPLRLFTGFLIRAIVPRWSSCTIICVCSDFSIFPSEFCKLRCPCMVDANAKSSASHMQSETVIS